MSNWRTESPEVFYAPIEHIAVGGTELNKLKRLALQNPRRRARLCTHISPNDLLHEMFIVHYMGCYVRAHRHLEKVESILVLEGEGQIVFFEESGGITEIVTLSATDRRSHFYHRIPKMAYHMILISSEVMVFHETTTGPYVRAHTTFPDWSPPNITDENCDFMSRVETASSHTRNTK